MLYYSAEILVYQQKKLKNIKNKNFLLWTFYRLNDSSIDQSLLKQNNQ